VHVPFCVHRCGYCDFTLVAGKDHLAAAYLEALETDLRTLDHPREVETLFIGGGTPTHLAPGNLERLLRLVTEWFPLAAGGEFSVEANPAEFEPRKMELLAEAGVNRVSLGVQSFDAEVLRFLERDHTPADIERVRADLARYFTNVSFDLIFGVPGQTLAGWRDTLQRALALELQHISTYGLTFEKGTQFWSRREKGEIVQIGDELERDMYAAAMDELPAAGFDQYEISNFARPGFACRHNQVYWAGLPYCGFGPGAARYLDGRRQMNHRSTTTWIERIRRGRSPIADEEQLSPEDSARELAVLGLRTTAGIDEHVFTQRTGYELVALAGDAIEQRVADGLLERAEGRLRLTREGRFLADTVVADFL
jgi:oxygen-independent coproporphyrinogen-3 oxidase